jgi:hypothetical protein
VAQRSELLQRSLRTPGDSLAVNSKAHASAVTLEQSHAGPTLGKGDAAAQRCV